MFPYRVKYTESESDIQNNNLLYKIRPKCQNTFETLKSKSTVYPPKQTRKDVSGHAIESLNRCASFIKIYYFRISLDTKIVHTSGKMFDLGGRNISILGVEKCRNVSLKYAPIYNNVKQIFC